VSVSLVAGANSLVVRPDSFGTAISSISDGFALFRVKRLRFRCFAFTAACAVGVVTSIPNTLPASRTAVIELRDSITHEALLQTSWSNWVNVSPSTFSGPFTWYHTRAGTYDFTETIPCTFVAFGAGTNVVDLEIFGVMEFKDEVPTTSTPEERALLTAFRAKRDSDDKLRARARQLALLSDCKPDEIPSSVSAIFNLPSAEQRRFLCDPTNAAASLQSQTPVIPAAALQPASVPDDAHWPQNEVLDEQFARMLAIGKTDGMAALIEARNRIKRGK